MQLGDLGSGAEDGLRELGVKSRQPCSTSDLDKGSFLHGPDTRMLTLALSVPPLSPNQTRSERSEPLESAAVLLSGQAALGKATAFAFDLLSFCTSDMDKDSCFSRSHVARGWHEGGPHYGTSLIRGVDDHGGLMGQLCVTPRDGCEPTGNFLRDMDAPYGVVS